MERFETVIIGGGQSGLAAGYFLSKQGRSFMILDAHERVGDAWRRRWDSLRVFTPALVDGLPGMPFPGKRFTFPTKDEVADYMETYAKWFGLPVRTGVKVDCVAREGDRFVITSNAGTFEADNVIVATGAHHKPKTPPFAGELDPRILQIHSSEYRNPAQLRDGATLVVGLGNSGAEIAYDLRAGRHVFVAGKPVGQVPVRHGSTAFFMIMPLIGLLGMHVMTVDNPIGRKVLPKLKVAPLVRVKVKDLEAAGIEQVGRVTGVRDGMPLLEDGRTLDVANIIWCTGFSTDLGWIKVPAAFGPDGALVQYRGAATAVPGLYFVGMWHQYAQSSDVLPGVGRDAAYVTDHLAARPRLAGRLDSEDRMVRRDPAEVGVR
ncbi:MAG TPA: NAD(P)-binding domain-containing protein [Candidatus Dormibacteraeota bacterium]|jgi:putative flavoprotein involved in K+ transport|nr:NAD(P)-binding domain-containing protein [Candidatus Dormibacteraeota bacterium]